MSALPRLPFGQLQGFIRNVLAAPGARPADTFDSCVGLQLGGGDRRAEGGDGENSTAGGENLAVDKFRSRVKNLHIRKDGGFFETSNRTTFFVWTGIAFAGHDNADAGAVIPLQWTDFVQLAVYRGFQQTD